METKHTKGEWEVNGNGVFPRGRSNNICTVSRQVYDLNSNGTFKSDEESFANAQLIASAPELLDGCELFLEYLKRKGDTKSVMYNSIQLLIKKATE